MPLQLAEIERWLADPRQHRVVRLSHDMGHGAAAIPVEQPAHLGCEQHGGALARRLAGVEVEIIATVRTADRTGVEMEALTAAAVGGLTVIDMVKGRDRSAAIREVVLLEKLGGRSVGLTYGYLEGEFGVSHFTGIIARVVVGLADSTHPTKNRRGIILPRSMLVHARSGRCRREPRWRRRC